MSVINRMLQDLDRRQAGVAVDGTAPAEVRAVRVPRSDREWFWRIVSVLLLGAVGWVAWVAYQMQPTSVVTPLALKSAPFPQAAAPAVAPVAPAKPAPAAPAAPPVSAPAPAPVAAAPGPPPIRKSEPAPTRSPETFKLATAIERPIPEQPVAARTSVSPAAAPEPAKQSAPRGAPSAAAVSAQQAPKAAAPPRAPSGNLDLGIPPARVLPAPATAKVEKREPARSSQQRAEADFRRAVGLLNQGRASEAEETLNAALGHDHAFHPARQALIALLIDSGRVEDARRHLQEGLAIDPRHVRFATVLARLFAERKDYASALAVIERARTEPASSAEFSALHGTVLQRLGRHREAVEAYTAALRLDQTNGAAWVGLGLSLEATQRPADAAAAYRRASALPNLGEEVKSFAAQRARQLQ